MKLFSIFISLEEDKRSLENEKARIPNQQEIDDKVKALRQECEDLKRQIIQKKSEVKDQTVLIADKRKKINATIKQHEEFRQTIDTLEVIILFDLFVLRGRVTDLEIAFQVISCP
jgi:predicted  nucleic acid-binding Zn-ribbon protein